MKFLQRKDIEVIISTLRKLVGQPPHKPEHEIQVSRSELAKAVKELRNQDFSDRDHTRFLFELLCERVGSSPHKGIDVDSIKQIVKEEKLPYDDDRLIEVLVGKITKNPGRPLTLEHLEDYRR